MLERQPADVQRLLVRTSMLDRVNGELGDLLTGSTGSDRILLDLEDANAFVVSLDPDRTWFRPPGLDADGPDLALARAASELARGDLDDAAAHLAVPETLSDSAPPDRRHRVRVTIASLKLSLARRRGNLADVLDVLHGSSLAPGDASSAQIEQLSPSELKILRYLPTNMSRPEIASELSVSVNTVNTHIRNIYAKLGAQDRSSAVQRARELRLVSAGRTRS